MAAPMPEQAVYSPFPACMPPVLVWLAVPLWQIEPSWGYEDEPGGIVEYYVFTYEDAKYLLAKLLDFQTPVVLSGFEPVIYDDNIWTYDGYDNLQYAWDIDYDYARKLNEFELPQYSITGGLAAMERTYTQAKKSHADCMFELHFRDAEKFLAWLQTLPEPSIPKPKRQLLGACAFLVSLTILYFLCKEELWLRINLGTFCIIFGLGIAVMLGQAIRDRIRNK